MARSGLCIFTCTLGGVLLMFSHVHLHFPDKIKAACPIFIVCLNACRPACASSTTPSTNLVACFYHKVMPSRPASHVISVSGAPSCRFLRVAPAVVASVRRFVGSSVFVRPSMASWLPGADAKTSVLDTPPTAAAPTTSARRHFRTSTGFITIDNVHC